MNLNTEMGHKHQLLSNSKYIEVNYFISTLTCFKNTSLTEKKSLCQYLQNQIQESPSKTSPYPVSKQNIQAFFMVFSTSFSCYLDYLLPVLLPTEFTFKLTSLEYYDCGYSVEFFKRCFLVFKTQKRIINRK